MNAKYTPHHREHAEGHIYIDKPGACTIQLTGAAAMSQHELDRYGRIAAEAIARNGNHLARAKSDAAETVLQFADAIVEQISDYAEAPRSLFDYDGGDRWHYETHMSRDYSLLEAAQLLDELRDFEETDNGLWEGERDAKVVIRTMAAYTYGNAVLSHFETLIERINDRATELANDLDEWPDAETLRNLVQAECATFATS